jgi:hypothetical protein
MKQKTVWIVLVVLLVGYTLPTFAAPALLQINPTSGSFGDPGDLYLSYTISGVDFSQDTDGNASFYGRYTGAPIHFSGRMVVSRSEGSVSYVSMSASLGDQSVQWPKEGEDNAVSGKTVELPFDFTFQVPPDYAYSTVTGSAFVQACGGVCGTYAIDLTVQMPEPTPTPTPPLQPKPPCEDPMFLYPGLDLSGHFTGQPALRYSGQEMKDDVLEGLQRFINEGNTLSSGARTSDPYFVAKSYINSAMPTGREAALQDAARRMAQERQQTDPSYRLSPGDLFYLSLKQNNGNVRDALLTCHAALYRDGGGVNKKFIEQENILTPLRNPEGYPDRDTGYTTPRGSERSINPFKELGHEEQGPWYHFFGLMALEFTDPYGAASFHAAWLALEWDSLPANYTDMVLAPDFPKDKLDASLGKLSVALEHNVRTNMGKPPDIAKYCVNYYALAAGKALKAAVFAELGKPVPNAYSDRFGHFDNAGDILTPEGTVIYKSPLSIYIQGVNGEWFSFDPRSGVMDGNTPLVYFEILPEEDGSSSFLGAPFFEVASVQMTGVGEGPVTLGMYDRASEKSSVFEFDVHDGDQILVEGMTGTPLLNSDPLKASDQTGGILPAGLVSGNHLGLLLIAGCGGLLVLLVMVGLVVFLSRGRRRSTRPVPARQPAGPAPAASCPHCGATVKPGARFCGSCGRSITAPTPAPSRAAAPPAASHLPTPVPAGDDATVIANGPGSTWQLAVESGPNTGQRYSLGLQTRLGRNPDNEVQLDDARASRHHAVLQRQGSGYVLNDLNSSNGTFVNGSRVGQPTPLQPGDVIQIGQITLKVLES